MERRRFALTVLAALAVLAAWQLIRAYPALPRTIAVHFGPGGQADGWSDKLHFIILYGIVEGALVALALGGALLADRIPVRMWNLPNREFWLHPDRRAGTLAFISETLIWIENATLAFLIAIAELVVRANLAPGVPILSRSVWAVLVVFVTAVSWLSLRVYARFRRPLFDR